MRHSRPFSASIARFNVTGPVHLRPYQEEAIQAVLDHVAKDKRRLGLSLPTGSGKTVIFSHLVDRITPPTEDATQTLILAHRQELVHQAETHCKTLYPGQTVEVEMSASKASGSADITIASVQSLRDPQRLAKYDPRRFKLVLVDEAHHTTAKTYMDILNHFGLLSDGEEAKIVLVGVTATFQRADGVSLGKAFRDIAIHK